MLGAEIAESAIPKKVELPSAAQLRLSIDAIAQHTDRNREYNNSVMAFWPQAYEKNASRWVSTPANLLNAFEVFTDLPWDQIDKVLEYLGLKDVEDFIKHIIASRSGYTRAFHIPPDFDDTFVNLGLGALLTDLGPELPEALSRWRHHNTNLTSVLDALKSYAYRPFSQDKNVNTIDPRTYYYIRHFLDYAKNQSLDVALVPTWIQNIEEARENFDRDVVMPFQVNNVDVTVAANAVYGITASVLSGLLPPSVLQDPQLRQIYHNTTSLIAFMVEKALFGRPDLALTYYPSVFEFYWFVARTYHRMETALRSQPLPEVMQDLYPRLRSVLEGPMTQHVVTTGTPEGPDMLYYDDFLGDADLDNNNNTVVKAEDRLYTTTMAANALLTTWTLFDPTTRTGHWKEATPPEVKTTVDKCVRWLSRYILHVTYKPWNAFFSGSAKGSTTLPFYYPYNRLELMNGTDVPTVNVSCPLGKHTLMFGMEGYVSEAEYQARFFENTQPNGFKFGVALNESGGELQKVCQNVAAQEDGILQLKEALLNERKEALREKDRLQNAVAEEHEEKLHTDAQIFQKASELGKLECQLTATLDELDFTREQLQIYEDSPVKLELEEEEKALEAQLADLLEKNEQLREKTAQISRDCIEEKTQKTLLRDMEQMEKEIDKKSQTTNQLQKMADPLLAKFDEKDKIRADDAARMKEAEGQIRSMKETMQAQAQMNAAALSETQRMNEELRNFTETHMDFCLRFGIQIGDFSQKLAHEKKERKKQEQEAYDLEKELRQARKDLPQLMSRLAARLKQLNEKHDKVCAERSVLEEDVEVRQRRIETLNALIYDLQRSTSSKKAQFCFKLLSMQNNVQTVTEAVQDKRVELDQMKIVRDAKDNLLQKERKMNVDEYFAHWTEQELNTDKDEETLWWGLDDEILHRLRGLQTKRKTTLRKSLITSIEGIDLIMGMTPQELQRFLREVAITADQEEALRQIMLRPRQRKEIAKFEKTVALMKAEIAEGTPHFWDLHQYFEDRTAKFPDYRKKLNKAKEKKANLEDELGPYHNEIADLLASQDALRLELAEKHSTNSRATKLGMLIDNRDLGLYLAQTVVSKGD
nr:hypothetical protein BaRGS_007471 [Batillaria attramentaria]